MEPSGKERVDLEGYLRRKGLKSTSARERILQEILSTESHFEAEEITRSLRRKGSRISQATVYRTLPLLVEAGFIQEVIHGEKHHHYERVRGEERHDHLICVQCGKIEEFQDASLREAEKRICRAYRFQPRRVVIEIFGYCRNCR